MWGTTGIGYNVAKAKERMGDQPINTWDVVFKPELISKFKDCGVYFLDSPEEVVSGGAEISRKLDPAPRIPRISRTPASFWTPCVPA